MRKILLVLLTSLMAISAFAQQKPDHAKNKERIKALRIAFITEKLDLKADQAERFWPVYNAYEKERWQLRKSFADKYRSENPSSDRIAAHQYIEANLEYQEQDLEIKKKYKDQLLKAISAEQLAELYRAESDFKQLLLKELSKRNDDPKKQ